MFRIVRSESFRGVSPADVRERWTFRDWVFALLLIEMDEGQRAEDELERENHRHGR